MLKIVVGGQINKQEILVIAKEILNDDSQIDIMGDLEASMAMKEGQYDYYIGACNTGGGGALAMAMALLGSENCATVSMPGRICSREEIVAFVDGNRKAFGFTAQHAQEVLEILLPILKNKE